ncbi:PKD domain-containing protein [bacterium]|nr:PKD domain-containing protein [bacterium]
MPDPATETRILLPSGGGAIFPAGAFAAATEVDVNESLTGAQTAAAGFPTNSGALLGATTIKVPAGVALNTNIEVRIGLAEAQDTDLGFTVFMFNPATSMWETTAAASALKDTAAVGLISGGTVVSFTATTAGTTGFEGTYGVFENLATEQPGGGTVEPNTIPTVDLTADATTVDPGVTVNLTATGADGDGDTLTFTWLAAGGTLGTPATTGNTSTATWSAAAAGSYVISVSANDGNGGVATDAVTVMVNTGDEPGENDPPVWEDEAAIVGDVTAPVVGQAIKLTGAHATDPEGTTLTYAWSGPGAFADEMDDEEHGMTVMWTPDAAGDATATLTANDGEHEITLDYTIAVSAYPTAFDFVGYATCLGCHADQGDEGAATGWFSTKHSGAIVNDMDNAHFARNEHCYDCHATGWGATGYGQGYIDLELTPEFANVGCEACHSGGSSPGAGSGHKNVIWNPLAGMAYDEVDGTWFEDEEYDKSQGVGCVRCHQGTRHGAGTEWVNSGHANFLLEEEGTVEHYLTVGSCNPCHSGKQFAVIHQGEDPLDLSGLTVDDPLEEHLITCATCHDPHSNQFAAQLRVNPEADVIIPFDEVAVNGGKGNICIECHNGRRTRSDYDDQIVEGSGHFGPHGNPQGAMFFGVMGADLGNPTVAADYDYEHPHLTWNEDTCITCHMYSRPYISSDDPALHGHEFAPRFERCITCHTNYTADDAEAFWTWVEEYQAEIDALLEEFVAAWPAAWLDEGEPISVEAEVGDGTGPPADDPVGNAYRAALWNYYLALNDATRGVHNPTFTKDLLEQAIAAVEALNAAP